MASRNRGVPKPKLRDLSTGKLTVEEKSAISQAFIDAPPIAAAIIGAVMVEHDLDGCLRRKFPRITDEDWGEMLGDRGPLRTFSAKITMGYALHIYGEATKDNLNIVRTIRNAFAHSKKLIDFKHDLIVAELRKVKVGTFRKRTFAKIQSGKWNGDTSYVILCYTLMSELMRHVTKSLSAKHARLNKKRSPLVNVLMRAADAQEPIGLSPLLSPQNQISGPNALAQGGLLAGLWPYFEQGQSKTDKK
jgi:hypothetical protein